MNHKPCQFLLGCTAAVLLLGTLAEVYLRFFPPKDLHAYLGEDSPLIGLYVADADFGVTYRSWDAFYADNQERMGDLSPVTDDRTTWAFFGNSFVQARGMLADTARQHVADHRIFNLGRNELLYIRLAQIKLLLEHGMRPERIFIELMPVDLLQPGEQPLATMYVTSKGALTYRPRCPEGALGWPIKHSRLGLTTWVRAGRHYGNPQFNKRTLQEGIDPILLDDLRYAFGNLARVSGEYGVPVSIVLIPTYQQVVQGASFGFQDTLAPMFRAQGLEVLDPRTAFCGYPDRPGLFLPDKHLTPAGNQLLLSELLSHVRAILASHQVRAGGEQ